MAKIMGVELKGVKNFRGMDFDGYAATVYVDGKKQGDIINDGNGGEVQGYINWDLLRERGEQYKAKYCPDSKYWNAEIFIEELLELAELEKGFKKNLKKGYNYFYALRRADAEGFVSLVGWFAGVQEASPEVIDSYSKKYGASEVKVYTALDQFVLS